MASTRATPAPTKINQVIQAQEQVELYQVIAGGKERYIEAYTAREIGASAGNIQAFIQANVVPWVGGGEFRIYKATRSGPQMIAKYDIAGPRVNGQAGAARQAPGAQQYDAQGQPVGPTPQSNILDQVNAFSSLSTAVQGIQASAKTDAAAAAAAKKEELTMLMGLAGGKKEGGGSGESMFEKMLMMKMMAPDKPDNSAVERSIEALVKNQEQTNQGLSQAFGVLDQKLAAAAHPPPPPPPPLPPPDYAGLVAAVGTAMGPVLTAIAAAATREPLPPPPTRDMADYIPLFAAATVMLKDAGMIGGDKITSTDLELVKVTAKLDAMAQSGGKFSDIKEVLEITAMMQPSQNEWVSLGSQALEQLPELLSGFNEAARIKKGAAGKGTGTQQITQSTGRKVTIPEALVKARDEINKIETDVTYNGEIVNRPGEMVPGKVVIVTNIIFTGVALGQAGSPWDGWIEEFIEATCEEDFNAAKLALAKIVAKAWGKGDKKAKLFLKKVLAVWEEDILLIGQHFRRILNRQTDEDKERDAAAKVADDAPDEIEDDQEEDDSEADAAEVASLLEDLEEDDEPEAAAAPGNGGGAPIIDPADAEEADLLGDDEPDEIEALM